MAILRVSKILEMAAKERKMHARAEVLKKYGSTVLEGVLFMMFADNAPSMSLPDGDPPYKPNRFDEEAEGNLYKEWRKLYIFIESMSPEMKQIVREVQFIQLLELLHSEDAKLLLAIKNKSNPYEGLTKEVAELAFPNLFNKP